MPEPKGCGLRRLRLSSEGKRENQPRPRTVCRRKADIQRACDTRCRRRELPQDTGAAEDRHVSVCSSGRQRARGMGGTGALLHSQIYGEDRIRLSSPAGFQGTAGG